MIIQELKCPTLSLSNEKYNLRYVECILLSVWLILIKYETYFFGQIQFYLAQDSWYHLIIKTFLPVERISLDLYSKLMRLKYMRFPLFEEWPGLKSHFKPVEFVSLALSSLKYNSFSTSHAAESALNWNTVEHGRGKSGKGPQALCVRCLPLITRGRRG